jgi:hypothetical protein
MGRRSVALEMDTLNPAPAAIATLLSVALLLTGCGEPSTCEPFGPVEFCWGPSAPLTRPYNCAAPLLPMTGETGWAHARSLACEDSDVVGGFSVYTRAGASASLSLEIPEDGSYRLAVFADTPNMKGVLTPCDVCSWRSDSVSAHPSHPDKRYITAGTYAFTYIVEQPESTLVAMTLERVTP